MMESLAGTRESSEIDPQIESNCPLSPAMKTAGEFAELKIVQL